jgi:hypothetical protein
LKVVRRIEGGVVCSKVKRRPPRRVRAALALLAPLRSATTCGSGDPSSTTPQRRQHHVILHLNAPYSLPDDGASHLRHSPLAPWRCIIARVLQRSIKDLPFPLFAPRAMPGLPGASVSASYAGLSSDIFQQPVSTSTSASNVCTAKNYSLIRSSRQYAPKRKRC